MKETLKNKPLVIQLGTALAIVIFLITWSFRWGGQMERINYEIEDTNSRVDHLSDKYVTMRQDITILQNQNNDITNRLTRIETILERIEKNISK